MIGSELSAVLLMMFLLFAKIILCLCRSDIIFICLNSRSEYHLALSQISLRSNFIRRKANITELLIHKSERAVTGGDREIFPTPLLPCGARNPFRISTAAPHFPRCFRHRRRSGTALPPVPALDFNFSFSKIKKAACGCFFHWRRQRDLNSRAGNSRPTPLAGAPLRPTWVCLRIFGGENRIRTYGTFRYHWFSRPAP